MRPGEGNRLLPVEEYWGVDEVTEKMCLRLRPRPAPGLLPTEGSYGRVLAADVVAPSDIPDRPRSHMDGFAVRAADLEGATSGRPVELKVRGEIGPRRASAAVIGPGQAAKVATGAPIPRGSDTVVPSEHAEERRGVVLVGSPLERGSFVYPQGTDYRRGEVVLREGHAVRAQDIGLLLSLGVEKVRVYRRPRVAVVATGSELTKGRPGRGLVRNTHSPVFLRLLEELGCEPVDAGIARDDSSEIATRVARALRGADLVITLGGTSVGKRDVAGDAISSLGPDPYFHGVRLDRGRVSGMALVEGKPVLMLPGPIQGAMTAFLIFGAPAARALGGRKVGFQRVSCVLGAEWRARKRFSGFTKVVYVALKDRGKTAEPMEGDTESVGVLVKADGFAVVPEGVTMMERGSRVDVNLLPGASFS